MSGKQIGKGKKINEVRKTLKSGSRRRGNEQEVTEPKEEKKGQRRWKRDRIG